MCPFDMLVRESFRTRWLPDAVHDHFDHCLSCATVFCYYYRFFAGPMVGPRTHYAERYLRTIGWPEYHPMTGGSVQ